MRAASPWKVVFPRFSVYGGGNPLGFFACGFSGIDEALLGGARLVDRFSTRTVGAKFVTRLRGDGYNALLSRMRKYWRPWSINVMGSLSTEAVDILNGGQVSNTSPSRIPAFTWYDEKGHTAYGSVAVVNHERFLEIATDSGTIEELQERVALLNDLDFTPVFP
jgi:hypothetical protein